MEKELRLFIRGILTEALTLTDKAEVERIAKKQAKQYAKEEVKKALDDKATRSEIAEITKEILKRLYRDMSVDKQYIIDRIKIK